LSSKKRIAAIYYEYTLQILENNAMSEVREWNILLNKIIYIALWSHSFTAGLEEMQ